MKDKLYRSKNDRILFGVCAGLADYFETDPTLVRLIFAVLLLSGLTFIVPLYIIMAIVIPENPDEKKEKKVKKSNNTYLLGAGLVIAGLIMLLDSYNIIMWKNLWPAILVIIGVFMIWGKKEEKQ